MKNVFLGEYIKQRRLDLGLTQEQLCDGICEPVTLSRLENGKQTAAKAFFVLTDSSFFDFYDFRLTAGNGEKLKKQHDV